MRGAPAAAALGKACKARLGQPLVDARRCTLQLARPERRMPRACAWRANIPARACAMAKGCVPTSRGLAARGRRSRPDRLLVEQAYLSRPGDQRPPPVPPPASPPPLQGQVGSRAHTRMRTPAQAWQPTRPPPANCAGPPRSAGEEQGRAPPQAARPPLRTHPRPGHLQRSAFAKPPARDGRRHRASRAGVGKAGARGPPAKQRGAAVHTVRGLFAHSHWLISLRGRHRRGT